MERPKITLGEEQEEQAILGGGNAAGRDLQVINQFAPGLRLINIDL